MAAALDVAALTLHDEDDEPVTADGSGVLGPVLDETRAVYRRREDLAHLADGELWAVAATGSRGLQEHVVHVPKVGSAPVAVYCECKITYEEVPPTQLVEYRFAAESEWNLAHVSLASLVSFRSGKFAAWEKRLLEPTCAAELRRMYHIGPVIRVYDHHMFPSIGEDKDKFEVKDEKTGKTVIIPRPVHSLRIWNAQTRQYDDVQAELEGAPSANEVEGYWDGLVSKMRAQWGDEEFDRMVSKED